MKLLFGIFACIGILSAPSFAAKVEGKAPKMTDSSYKLVSGVNEVTLKVTKQGGTVTITAKGTVISTGWTAPELAPYIYLRPPADGVYSFDFLAKAPGGIVGHVVLPIKATFVWKSFTSTLKAVRVVSAGNSITKPLIGH